MPKETLPKNWPSRLPYHTTPRYSKHLTQDQLSSLRRKPSDGSIPVIPSNTPRGPSSLTKITLITDPSHPANGQCGLIAARDLGPGQLIVQYIGELHSSLSPEDVKAHGGSDYDLWLERDAGVAIDAGRAGNEGRFVNDYRGIGERPNAEFREIWDTARGERGIAVFVLPDGKAKKGGKLSKGIKKGRRDLSQLWKGILGWKENRRGKGIVWVMKQLLGEVQRRQPSQRA